MINIKMQTQTNRLKPKITVVGVGGAGGNAVNNMINSHLEGCEFLVCNTDAQALEGNASSHKIQLGVNVTRGLGAGANPDVGRAAAEESIEDIMAYLEGSNMVFVTAGMGGGTGTGAAPVIAQAAREAGILTVGVITKPFHFEGSHRMKLAEHGIAELQKHVDTLIIIPNQNLFRIANEKTTFADAFKMADEVLQSGVRGVTDLMVMPGLINLDFADIRAVMAEMGKAMMGTGEAEGERRAVEAAEAAISNPLLDDVSMKGARGVLINITGGLDMTLFEVDEAANRIRDEVDPEANIIFGSTFDSSMQGKMRVSVVATGIEAAQALQRPSLQTATASVEPARSKVVIGSQYTGNGTTRPQMRETVRSSETVRETYGANYGTMGSGLPSSIMPQTQHHGVGMGATMRNTAPVMAQKASAPVATGGGDGWERSPEPQMTVGHAASQAYGAVATARKIETADVEISETWTKPANPVAQQPKAQRHGDTFIPPKPVDPRTKAADLFGDDFAAAPRATVPQQPVKKSPSIFERFSLNRDKVEAPVVSRETAPKMTVEEGGQAQKDDELDIPAFLRRQAN